MRTYAQQLTKLIQKKDLDLVVANDPGKTLTVALFKNDVAPTEATVVGDLTPATGAGMANQTSVVDNTAIDEKGNVKATFANVTFTTPTVQNPVEKLYGFAIFDADGDIMAWRRFPSPVSITTALLSVTLAITQTAVGTMIEVADLAGG